MSEYYQKDGLLYKTSLFGDEVVGKVEETSDGGGEVKDSWGNTIARFEPETFFGDRKATVEGATGTLTPGGLFDRGELHDLPVFRPSSSDSTPKFEETGHAATRSDHSGESWGSDLTVKYKKTKILPVVVGLLGALPAGFVIARSYYVVTSALFGHSSLATQCGTLPVLLVLGPIAGFYLVKWLFQIIWRKLIP